MARLHLALALVLLAAGTASAFFVVPTQQAPRPTRPVAACSSSGRDGADAAAPATPALGKALARALAAPALLLTAFLAPSPMSDGGAAWAISGGGKDWAEAKISGEDFSGKKYDSKDFSGAIAQQTNFKMSSFKGARFYKANLKEADFTGADLSGASLEGAALDGAILKNAILQNAYATETLAKVADVTGADFSDMLLDRFVQTSLCKKASGVNPKTGVDTRESLMCE